ncbi:MAG: hypothetical protein U5R31_15435 [Acidimicrobiia bacterium]|nr:hypothetical protein [Acidimicrobiia bacterium]
MLAVNDDGDRRDAVPGDGVCESVGGGDGCTLRAAVDEANAHPAIDEIAIEAGVGPVLTRVGGDEDANATGDLDVRHDLHLAGTETTTVTATHEDRVLDVRSGRVVLDEIGLTRGPALR